MDPKDETIVVTGFGPFGNHQINASWEAVKLLPSDINGIRVVVKEIPVSYSHVEKTVPLLWNKYSPILVIHVGVSSFASKITLESCAFREGYVKADCHGNKHPIGAVCLEHEGTNCIKGTIDVKSICSFLNSKDLKACVSKDAGRYLCEFIYYKSLSINPDRTMFIHVPPIGKPYSAEELAVGLKEIICCTLEQLRLCECLSRNAL